MIEEFIMRRLVYVKFIYLHGLEHNTKAEAPDTAIAVLNFDNSIEMLFHIILNQLGTRGNHNLKFLDLVGEIKGELKKKNPMLIIHDNEIRNMHEARNSIQHSGILPSTDDLKRYEVLTRELMTTLIPIFFEGIKLDEISMSLLIKDKLVRGLYKKAEQLLNSGNLKESLIYAIGAFEKAKSNEQYMIFGSLSSFYGDVADNYENVNKDFTKVVHHAIKNIYEELEVFKLRMDYKKYQKYREPFPYYGREFEGLDSEEEVYNKVKELIGKTLESLEQEEFEKRCKFCLSFTMDSILEWQSFERISLE